MSKKLSKKQIHDGFVSRRFDIDSRRFWSVYAEEQRKINIKNEKIFAKISKKEGSSFVDNLRDYITESNDGSIGHSELFEIHDELPEKYGKYYQYEDDFELGAFVNQTCNGGYTGDDFSGHIYVLLPNMNKYLYFTYNC